MPMSAIILYKLIQKTVTLPIIVDDRTLVPVRFIAESLGMDVGYNDSTRTVTLSGNGYIVNMTLDKSEYTINDIPFEMDVPAQVVNDRTLIPLRVIAESIGKRLSGTQTTD